MDPVRLNSGQTAACALSHHRGVLLHHALEGENALLNTVEKGYAHN